MRVRRKRAGATGLVSGSALGCVFMSVFTVRVEQNMQQIALRLSSEKNVERFALRFVEEKNGEHTLKNSMYRKDGILT